VISWATSDGRDAHGDRVVPAASTIKLFVASAFWRSHLDPAERVEVPAVPWSLADRLAGPLTLADCALLMLAVSDNAATNVLLGRLGFDAVNEEARRLGAERTRISRLMIADGPENLTCARDLARGLAAIDDARVLDDLAAAHDSLLPYLLSGRDVRVKTGELESAYHEVALVDGSLAVAVCSAPAALPSEVAAVAAELVGESLDRGEITVKRRAG
jgi:beta-lactamase class A